MASWFAGDNSISTFSAYLPTVGANLASFVASLGTFSEDQVSTITCAANAIGAITQAAENIPNEGGMASWFAGDNSISTFSAYLPEVGTNLAMFASNLGTFTDEQVSTVTCAANAIAAMATASQHIDGQADWAKKLFGDNSIVTFAASLPGLGTNMAEFAANLGTFGDDQVASVSCAATAIKEMAIASTHIDGQSDWAKKLFGDNSLATFGDELALLGEDLSSFADNLNGFNEEKVAAVNCAVDAFSAIATLGGKGGDLKNVNKNISDFGGKLTGLAGDLTEFVNGIPSKESMTAAVDGIKDAIAQIEDVAASNTDVAAKFIESLTNLATDGISGFVKKFTSAGSKSDVKDAAKTLFAEVPKGIEAKEKAAKDAVADLIDSSVDSVESRDNYDKFYSAGSYLVDGFAAGISENSYKAAAKAAAMAKAAAKAAEEALDINSPSKVGYGIGGFFGIGFVNALDDYANAAYDSSFEMADSAKGGLSDAINKVKNFINSDIDTQPTIRPVLDLSDVRSGVGAIDGMFGINPSVGVLANVGSINTMMNRRIQNGTNSDIIMAIDKLRKDLGNVGNTSYNINGVTYDDGSNIAEAVQAIIRAAKVERRT